MPRPIFRRRTARGRQAGTVELEFSKATRSYELAGEDDDVSRKVLRFVRENPGCSKWAVR